MRFKHHIYVNNDTIITWGDRTLEFDTVMAANRFVENLLNFNIIDKNENPQIRCNAFPEEQKWLNATYKELVIVNFNNIQLIDLGGF